MDDIKKYTFEELEQWVVDLHDKVRLTPTIKDLDRMTVYDLNAVHSAYQTYLHECATRDILELRVGDVIVNRSGVRYQITHLLPVEIVERYKHPEIASRVLMVRLLKDGKPSKTSTNFQSYSQIRDHYDVERTGMLSTVRQREKRQLEDERAAL